MMDVEDSLLNSKEVAEILDCSPDAVNELARKNVLPAFKRGRQWRFRKRDIASFKRQLRGTTAALWQPPSADFRGRGPLPGNRDRGPGRATRGD